jgi:formate dehydrogenase gamma subunit
MTTKAVPEPGAQGLVKHPLPQRILHWFNAACFLFLWLTGIGIVTSSGYRVAPDAYVSLLSWVFGDNTTLLHVHIGVGLTWFSVLVVSFLVDPYGLALRFLEDLKPTRHDLRWFPGKLRAELLDPAAPMPPQGAYNAGQKAFGATVLAGGAAIGLTGVLMVVGTGGNELSRWMVLIHLVAVGAVVAFFFVHFAMAALVREERPALQSMFGGAVDRGYAEHHHAEWYAARAALGGDPVRDDEAFGLPRAGGRLAARGWRWLVGRPEKPEWSPYAAGVGLGLTVVVAFALTGHGLGASGLFSRAGALALALVAPDHVAANATWGPVLDQGPITDYWLFWAMIGVFAGGFVSAVLGGRIESGVERGALVSPGLRIVLAVLGGALVGFATRFTRGCTSHQAISGGALLSTASWVFMLSVFAGGFVAAFFLRRVWR